MVEVIRLPKRGTEARTVSVRTFYDVRSPKFVFALRANWINETHTILFLSPCCQEDYVKQAKQS